MTRDPRAPEVLAPAGNLEKLKTAVAYGADAVYMSGKSFGLRPDICGACGLVSGDETGEGRVHARTLLWKPSANRLTAAGRVGEMVVRPCAAGGKGLA